MYKLPILNSDENCPYTFFGRIQDETDAHILISACRKGILPSLKHRLSQKQKEAVRPGYVFIYSRSEAGIRRWTDSRLWTPSKISGRFLHYFELHRRYSPLRVKSKPQSGPRGPKFHIEDINDLMSFRTQKELLGCPIAIRLKGIFLYKPDGLLKRTFTYQTKNDSYHLIAYEDALGIAINSLNRPIDFEELANIEIIESQS